VEAKLRGNMGTEGTNPSCFSPIWEREHAISPLSTRDLVTNELASDIFSVWLGCHVW
jgi:hypothetical protein